MTEYPDFHGDNPVGDGHKLCDGKCNCGTQCLCEKECDCENCGCFSCSPVQPCGCKWNKCKCESED